MTGEVLGRYRILERIGQGGMGEVYKAEDLSLHRLVALKALRCGSEEEKHRRLQHEARVASALSHPGIATVYEIVEAERDGERFSFIAMEYVAGRTLTEAGLAGVEEIVKAVLQVAGALDEAHRLGVVHRDVKPSNVIVTEGGRVKVLDFGLAMYRPALLDDRETWSRPGAVLLPDENAGGTVSYMSPEQALGRELDARTDVFSLGVLLYELLGRRLPFTGENLVAKFDALLRVDPVPLPQLNDAVSPELWRIVRKMLEKDRDRRYASLREVEHDLVALLREPGLGRRETSDRSVAVLCFVNVTGTPEDEWIGTGIAETVTADLKALGSLAVIGSERVAEVSRNQRAARPGLDERLATEVARGLGARWMVSGGYQRVGDRLRINARFLELSTGEVLHTVKVDGRASDLFVLQDRIVRELALGLPWLGGAGSAAPEDEAAVPAAYEAYTRGLFNRRASGREPLERAILLFERAVALDPSFVKAQVALAMAYDDKGQDLAAPELVERAVELFRRAVGRSPALAEGWRGLASALGYLGRDDEALDAVRRALDLNPADAAAHSTHARILFIGKARFAECAAELESALALNPQAGWAALQLSHARILLGELPAAEVAARRAVELQEHLISGKAGFLIVGAHARLAQVLAQTGRLDEAEAEFRRELDFLASHDHSLKERTLIEIDARLGSLLLARGQETEGRALLRRSVAGFEARLAAGADDPFTRFYAAVAHAQLGESARAIETLREAARRRKRFTLARAAIDPGLAPLRDDPAFTALLAS